MDTEDKENIAMSSTVISSGEADMDQDLVQQYKSLLGELRNNEDRDNEERADQLVKQVMRRSNSLFTQVRTSHQTLMDAQVVKQVSVICRQRIEVLSTNSTVFSVPDLADRLATTMGEELLESSNLEQSVHYNLGPANFARLGRQWRAALMNPCPSLGFLHGALDFECEQKQRKRRLQQEPAAEDEVGPATQQAVLSQGDQDPDSQNGLLDTERRVELILQQFMRLQNSGHQPVNFFRFVLHPSSFSSTIENMFYVSFLVKDGKLSIHMDETNQLQLLPVERKSAAGLHDTPDEWLHDCMSLTMEEWKGLVGKLCI